MCTAYHILAPGVWYKTVCGKCKGENKPNIKEDAIPIGRGSPKMTADERNKDALNTTTSVKFHINEAFDEKTKEKIRAESNSTNCKTTNPFIFPHNFNTSTECPATFDTRSCLNSIPKPSNTCEAVIVEDQPVSTLWEPAVADVQPFTDDSEPLPVTNEPVNRKAEEAVLGKCNTTTSYSGESTIKKARFDPSFAGMDSSSIPIFETNPV